MFNFLSNGFNLFSFQASVRPKLLVNQRESAEEVFRKVSSIWAFESVDFQMRAIEHTLLVSK